MAASSAPHLPGAAGRHAASPWAMPLAAWKAVALRSWREAGDDNVGLIAAGVAFYGFLALVPLLGAVVLSYGLVADPETVIHDMNGLTAVMPADAARLVGEQLMNVVETSSGKKGLGVLLSLALALFGARNGAGSVINALNIAYEEKENRGFILVNLLALAITAGAVLTAIVALAAIAALGHLESLFPAAPGVVLVVGKLLSYVLLACAGAAAAATLYRYGPSRETARWTWITPGSLFATICWLLLTLGFGIYVARFGNYNATYGSLGAVVVLLTWLYLSSYALLFGAELNSELERQRSGGPATEPAAPSPAVQPPSAEPIAAPPTPAPAPPTILADYAGARVAMRLGRAAGLKDAGAARSAMATLGLSLLRTRKGAIWGGALIALAAASAWLAPKRGRGPSRPISGA